MAFQVIRGDIGKVKADALVSVEAAADAAGEGTSPTIRRVREKEGPAVKYRIRFDAPAWREEDDSAALRLGKQLDEALELAAEHGCKSIVFPPMTGGTYGFPKERELQIATDSFRRFLEKQDMRITLVVPESGKEQISGALFQDVRSYLDDRGKGEDGEEAGGPTTELPQPGFDGMIIRVPLEGMPQMSQAFQSSPMLRHPQMPKKRSLSIGKPSVRAVQKGIKKTDFSMESAPGSLEERLRSMYTDSFEKHLQQLINKKGMKNSEVYAAANISKQYFSKLMKGQVKPSKEKVLALAVGLRLNLDEAIDFLRIAGYALSPVSQTDVVVEYFIRKKDYNVMKIDIVLFDYGLPTLSE